MRGGIAALLSLAVGLGVGYLIGASNAPGSPPRTKATAPRAADVPADVRPSGNSALARAIDDLPLPETERGTGAITGRVARADGTAVAGATVRATLRGPTDDREPRGGPPPPRDIEEEVRRLVADVRREQLTRADAVTDRDGRYALSGLADGPHRLAAYLEGFRISPARAAEASRARPGAVVDFLADPVAEVVFEVVLPDGTRAPDATIMLKSGNDTSELAWRRDEPRIAVRRGEYMCAADHDDHAYRSDEIPLDLRDGAPPPQIITLRLKGVSGIRGTLSFAPDLPFRWASIHALAFVGENPPGPGLLVDQGKSAWWDGRDRRYAIVDLPPARYLVGVSLNGSVLATRVVDVSGRMETCDLAVDRLDPSLYVVVRVLDPSGKPLSDVSFGTAYRTATGSSSSSGSDVFPRADGSFVVLNQPTNGREGGTHSVTAKSARYGEKEVSYKAGEPNEIIVRFGDPATLDLVLTGFDARDYPAAVTAVLVPHPAEAEDLFFISDDTAPDAEGRLALGPVEPGEYEVAVRVCAGSSAETLVAATRRVTLGPGKNALSLPMPRLHSLVVVDPERNADRPLVLTLEGKRFHSEIHAEFDDRGRARFEPLPEGSYQLARQADASGAMRVSIPGPAEIVFKPSPYDALRVSVVDADGPWGKAGLLDGDLIVAVDGKDLASPDELRRAYAALAAAESATLSILRAGSRTELKVNGRELLAEAAEGGYLEWTTR